MYAYLKWTFLIAGLLGLTSCASLSTQPPAATPSISLENRENALARIQNWDLKGVIAIKNNRDAWSANWQWHQQQKNYTIALFGPLGANSVQLTGSPGSVLLETSDGKKFTATSPESLLEQQLGWRLPVSNLRYWIRGLPVPGISAQKKFDASHRLMVLIQEDWRIEYLRYTAVNQLDLPSKIVLTNPQINVKMIINQW